MHYKVSNKGLNQQKKSQILDLIEDVERWDNAYHRELAFEAPNSLAVKQNIALREECIKTLINYLSSNANAFSFLNIYKKHKPLGNQRFNRSALSLTLNMIQSYELKIQDSTIPNFQEDLEKK
jgi:hypothetical protein